MRIINVEDSPVLIPFGELEAGDVFQRQDSKKLYLKSSHSSGEGGNAVRLANGLRSTFKDGEDMVVRDDAAIVFTNED